MLPHFCVSLSASRKIPFHLQCQPLTHPSWQTLPCLPFSFLFLSGYFTPLLCPCIRMVYVSSLRLVSLSDLKPNNLLDKFGDYVAFCYFRFIFWQRLSRTECQGYIQIKTLKANINKNIIFLFSLPSSPCTSPPICSMLCLKVIILH